MSIQGHDVELTLIQRCFKYLIADVELLMNTCKTLCFWHISASQMSSRVLAIVIEIKFLNNVSTSPWNAIEFSEFS